MRIPCSLILLVLSAAPAAAAFEPQDKRRDDEPQFDRAGDAAKKAAETREAASPEQLVDRALPLIVTWPAPAGENALRALIARGPEMIPLLRARLAGGTVLERAAAARGLSLLGDRESFDAIEKLFADPRQRTRYTALLASLHDLDAAKATELALEYLDSQQAPLRKSAIALIESRMTPELRAALKQRLLETRDEAVRLDLFEDRKSVV